MSDDVVIPDLSALAGEALRSGDSGRYLLARRRAVEDVSRALEAVRSGAADCAWAQAGDETFCLTRASGASDPRMTVLRGGCPLGHVDAVSAGDVVSRLASGATLRAMPLGGEAVSAGNPSLAETREALSASPCERRDRPVMEGSSRGGRRGAGALEFVPREPL